LGNTSDYFVEGFQPQEGQFLFLHLDKIEEEIYNKKKGVLIVGDNVSDLVFDTPLIMFLQKRARKVYYAVKREPFRNDLSMRDVYGFGLMRGLPVTFVPGTDYVGIWGEDLERMLEGLGGVDTVIVKGMANYETLSEWVYSVPVIHIMKTKCRPVSEAIGVRQGSYVIRLFGA